MTLVDNYVRHIKKLQEVVDAAAALFLRGWLLQMVAALPAMQMSYPDGMDCIFCKIIAGTIPSKKVYEDDRAYAFADIDPKAPVHLLIIPKKHIPSLADIDADDSPLLGHLHAIAKKLAAEQNLSNGFRTVINTGPDGGQTVSHLHMHLLGGRHMHWPPG
jgi:histidine triad (HIT) family protein